MSSDRRSVLVVDDSPFVRRVVRDVIDGSGEFHVVGEASNGFDAIRQVHALSPDLVTLDVEMPSLDGLQALGYLMSEAPRPVVMISALETMAGADLTLRALELGAVDFVRKPGGEESLDLPTLRVRLLSALRAASASRAHPAPFVARSPRPPVADERAARRHEASSRIVVIAASTGGPRALAEIVPALPPDLNAAVVIVQHMPPGFTESLARRLDGLAQLAVREAVPGERLQSGVVWVAPGGRHLVVEPDDRGGARFAIDRRGPLHGVAPAADLLFESAAQLFGERTVAVVLTGMGFDGAAGLERVRQGGGYAIVQDRESCVVAGMPQAALARAGADRVAALHEVGRAIVDALESRGTSGRRGA